MKTNKTPPYKLFGDLLVQFRLKAGIGQQSELASLVKTTQQSISRWERGLSRPPYKQMPLLSSILNVDVDMLLLQAGYAVRTVVANFDQPFPIDALSPDSFERFCLYLLRELYPNAQINRVGSQGHKQDGVDVNVVFPDKSQHHFQCKRVDQFGPAQVSDAIEKHNGESTKNVIVLSRVASPQARKVLLDYSNWEIWDREDVSCIIRQKLSKEQQLRIVDIFFKGQRLALLGETESGPWQKSQEFFAPFENKTGAFNHAWELVGRSAEIQSIREELCKRETKIIFLAGPGGAGKTRVLKQAIKEFEFSSPAVVVRFLSGEPTNKNLQDLARTEKVLIVDDAHDRNDLAPLFQHAASVNDTKIVLACRPYGLERIRSQAIQFALAGEQVHQVRLEPLTLEQSKQLAIQVLKELNGSTELADNIARATLDCPLATVIGAQVLAKEKKPFELIKNHETFRSILFGKFRQIIAGDIGNTADSVLITRLLKILALIQPFHPEDESIIKIVEQVEGLSISDTPRLIRLLAAAGVLFKRGAQYRLSPDMLADFIIEDSCITESGNSTGYADKVFEAASYPQKKHLLINLAKLDWRRSNGNPSNSQLLDELWKKLCTSDNYLEATIDIVTDVAFFQPSRALDFAEHLIRKGISYDKLPKLIKNAGCNQEYLLRACGCLWEIGKSDNRPLNQYPWHAIRILSELCAVEPHKPLNNIETVIDFAISLLGQESSWSYFYTPFDILKGILQTEVHTINAEGVHMVMEKFSVSALAVAALRAKVIDAALELLPHSQTKKAILSAKFLRLALQGPIGGNRQQWTEEFVRTLKKIELTIRSHKLHPLVIVEILHATSWHAKYANGETKDVATRIFDLQPATLEFRTIRALADGNGQLFEHRNYEQHQSYVKQWLGTLVTDLILEYNDGNDLWVFLERQLLNISTNSPEQNTAIYELYREIINRSKSFALLITQIALEHPTLIQADTIGMALTKILKDDHNKGLEIANQFLVSDSRELLVAIGRGYSWSDILRHNCCDKDLTILSKVLGSKDPWAVTCVIHALHAMIHDKQRLRSVIDLVRHIDLTISKHVADSVFEILEQDEIIKQLIQEDIAHFLGQLAIVESLDEFWIEQFLSKISKVWPDDVASFFMRRIEYAITLDAGGYRPCNYDPYNGQVLMKFRESENFAVCVRKILVWMTSREDGRFRYYAAELFCFLFQPFDDELLSHIQGWLSRGNLSDIRMACQLLFKIPHNFVFEHPNFVCDFLEQVKQYDSKLLDEAVKALYSSSITSLKSGVLGEPFPEDLQMAEKAEKILRNLSRFSPAYELYDMLKKHAEHEIQNSQKEREALEL